MNQTTPLRQGLYFEEFKVGLSILSAARTVTESDIVSFAGLSGDYNSIHTDAVHASKTIFGQRIAHGLLCMAIASGLANSTGAIEGTTIAFREIRNWKFSQPVFIGDTIHIQMDVTKTTPMPRLNGGTVHLKISVLNQDDVVVMKGTWIVLVESQPS